MVPDLQVLAIRDLYIEPGRASDSRILRYSTTIFNGGDGPLDLTGTVDADMMVTATQRMALGDGNMSQHDVGRFVFDGSHAHWHFEDFTLVQIWTYGPTGDLQRVVASKGKGTFCAVDELPEVAGAAEPAYFTCGDGIQGISAG
ncbi:MAG TPA: hypothetical protein VIH21_08675, partial [Dehalococcoidia bacterium]